MTLHREIQPSALQATAADVDAAAHNPGIDALRGCITLLVVFHHAAITYGAVGGWFYREVATDTSLASILLVLFCTINQSYFMGLFFLLAGYFTPPALRRKGPARFLLDRFVRLGLPSLFFGWILGPATIALAETHRGRPFLATLLRLWKRGTFEIGPLWFAEALLVFALATVLVSLLPRRDWLAPSTREAQAHRLPSNWILAGAALATGLASVALRSEWPVGVNVWNLQLAYFSGYILLFAAGCAAARPRWLENLEPARVRTWWRIALVAIPTLPTLYFLVPALRGRPLEIAYAFWEPLVAWGTIMTLLQWFQGRFKRPDGRLLGLWQPLARRAYAIYIIHPPVLVGVALAWAAVPANALLKFVVTGSISCMLCFVIAGLLLRLPTLRRII